MKMELFADVVPKTAENFRYLFGIPFSYDNILIFQTVTKI